MPTKTSFWDDRVQVSRKDAARAHVGMGLVWTWACLLSEPWVERAPRRVVHALLRGGSKALLRHLGVRLDVHGAEHIARGQRYVVVSLHEGLVDVPALLHLPLPLRFVARDELFGWPLLGAALKRTKQIEVRPEDGARAYRTLLRHARDVFAEGESVAIFAQGTILGLESDFQGGAFHLARALDKPILPVALSGSHRVWEHPYTPTVRYGERVSVRVLPPISVEDVRGVPLDELRVRTRRQLKAAALTVGGAAPRRFDPERDGWWDGYKYDIDPDFPDLFGRVRAHREGAPRETPAGPDGPAGHARARTDAHGRPRLRPHDVE
ncbi:lysophospholipid acyltransferase family protein [Deinococcus yavapaiensis]|uniref:lysophospholipid acyltransferase family protein n=1 Tax=Deinococcus yavapaiensis TaxID=309889 RepID=UPI0014733D0B|nr:lysophospholipid acyltransferase family protein [Deinococcus yavapaiensis]